MLSVRGTNGLEIEVEEQVATAMIAAGIVEAVEAVEDVEDPESTPRPRRRRKMDYECAPADPRARRPGRS